MRLFKSTAGFTLIELLVVIGIIGVLAAVVIPNVARFTGSGNDQANTAERVNIQTALDAYMAVTGLNPGTQASTNNMGAAANVPPLFPEYVRFSKTKCHYSWDPTGLVKQESCP